MRFRYGALTILVGVLIGLSGGCGWIEGGAGSSADAGAKACGMFRDDPMSLDTIRKTLGEIDAPTRRAFAEYATALDTLDNYFDGSYDPNTLREKRRALRSACLAEHSIELPE